MKKYLVSFLLFPLSLFAQPISGGLVGVPLSPGTGSNVVPAGSVLNGITINNANIVTEPVFVMVPFDTAAGANALYLKTSVDGYNFTPNGLDPIIKASPQTAWARDARIVKWNGVWYMSYLVGNNTTIPLASSTNWANWTFVTNVPCLGAGQAVVWPNHFFVDPTDNSLHMITIQQNGSDSLWAPYEQHLLSATNITTWSSPVRFTSNLGNNNWTNVWTNTLDTEIFYWNGYYYDFFKQECIASCAYIGLARSTNLISGWEVCPTNGVSGAGCTNNWAGWGVGYEGQSILRLPNGDFRIYFEQFSGAALWASDCSAANFPLGPWSAKKQVYTGDKIISDPAFVILTNAVDIQILLGAKQGLNFSAMPLDEPHGPYYDYVIGPNISSYGSTNAALNGWQGNELIKTNRASLSMNMFTGTANNPEIDFIYLPKGGLAGGQGWSVLYSMQLDGFHGPVVGTTVSASSGFISTGTGMMTGPTNSVAPVNTVTPAGWINYTNGGATLKIPFYQ